MTAGGERRYSPGYTPEDMEEARKKREAMRYIEAVLEEGAEDP